MVTEFTDHICVTMDAELIMFLHDLVSAYLKEKEKGFCLSVLPFTRRLSSVINKTTGRAACTWRGSFVCRWTFLRVGTVISTLSRGGHGAQHTRHVNDFSIVRKKQINRRCGSNLASFMTIKDWSHFVLLLQPLNGKEKRRELEIFIRV